MKTQIKTAGLIGISVAALLAAGTALADVSMDDAAKLQESGEIKSYDALNQIALKEHPGATITDTELEDSHGKYVYELELRDETGQEWDMDIDAASGEVLQNQQDD